ncbi:hypothetical protein AM1_6390 [Acaryochloris marina MBIC11017]|uniref:Uncharacterized protein n=1 Tax=Acaryochloris marina (strain MBIC 11017) TaxID=329726 RepID=B0C8Q9_ACAM1|nr:hypothetical protein AM1_6390 [Acaryochloris marina MBIC11017]
MVRASKTVIQCQERQANLNSILIKHYFDWGKRIGITKLLKS